MWPFARAQHCHFGKVWAVWQEGQWTPALERGKCFQTLEGLGRGRGGGVFIDRDIEFLFSSPAPGSSQD